MITNKGDWTPELLHLTQAVVNGITKLRHVTEDLKTAEQEWDDPQTFMFFLKRAHNDVVEVIDTLRLTVKGRI